LEESNGIDRFASTYASESAERDGCVCVCVSAHSFARSAQLRCNKSVALALLNFKCSMRVCIRVCIPTDSFIAPADKIADKKCASTCVMQYADEARSHTKSARRYSYMRIPTPQLRKLIRSQLFERNFFGSDEKVKFCRPDVERQTHANQ
jgi:hypothetical protein